MPKIKIIFNKAKSNEKKSYKFKLESEIDTLEADIWHLLSDMDRIVGLASSFGSQQIGINVDNLERLLNLRMIEEEYNKNLELFRELTKVSFPLDNIFRQKIKSNSGEADSRIVLDYRDTSLFRLKMLAEKMNHNTRNYLERILKGISVIKKLKQNNQGDFEFQCDVGVTGEKLFSGMSLEADSRMQNSLDVSMMSLNETFASFPGSIDTQNLVKNMDKKLSQYLAKCISKNSHDKMIDSIPYEQREALENLLLAVHFCDSSQVKQNRGNPTSMCAWLKSEMEPLIALTSEAGLRYTKCVEQKGNFTRPMAEAEELRSKLENLRDQLEPEFLQLKNEIHEIKKNRPPQSLPASLKDNIESLWQKEHLPWMNFISGFPADLRIMLTSDNEVEAIAGFEQKKFKILPTTFLSKEDIPGLKRAVEARERYYEMQKDLERLTDQLQTYERKKLMFLEENERLLHQLSDIFKKNEAYIAGTKFDHYDEYIANPRKFH